MIIFVKLEEEEKREPRFLRPLAFWESATAVGTGVNVFLLVILLALHISLGDDIKELD